MKFRWRLRHAFLILLLSFALLTSSTPGKALAESQDLNIDPVYQETPVWCWVAVGEMVFKHYDLPNVNPGGDYQCGIIGTLAGPSSPCWNDCGRCVVAAGYMQNIREMLTFYPRVIRRYIDPDAKQLSASYDRGALSESQVKEELDENRPVIAGINPSGFPPAPGQSMHVSLIVGYDEDEDGDLILTVNDPFPYDLVDPHRTNPFEAAGGNSNGDGSYTINYSSFRRNLVWNSSISKIE